MPSSTLEIDIRPSGSLPPTSHTRQRAIKEGISGDVGKTNPRKCGGLERNSVFEIDHEVYVDTANRQRKFLYNSIFRLFLPL